MKKFMKVAAMAMVGLFMFLPMVNVHAEEGVVEVSTMQELYDAVDGDEAADVKSVKLMNDIEIDHKINVTTDKVIDGNGHKITFVGEFSDGGYDNTVWGSNDPYPYDQGVYVIQVYQANVTIKNIALTGGNVGLSSNGGNLTLEGNIDVSGNGYGGIELTKGQNVEVLPSLTLNNVTLKNDNESSTVPTVYTDGLTAEEVEQVNVEYNGVKAAVSYAKEEGKPAQVLLYLNESSMPEENEKYTALNAEDFQPEAIEEPTEPTDPVEDETQDRVEDATENPETSDGILLFASLAVIGLAGTALAYRRLHN